MNQNLNSNINYLQNIENNVYQNGKSPQLPYMGNTHMDTTSLNPINFHKKLKSIPIQIEIYKRKWKLNK